MLQLEGAAFVFPSLVCFCHLVAHPDPSFSVASGSHSAVWLHLQALQKVGPTGENRSSRKDL